MKLYAPRYYKDFKCIADKCEHSCCVGWEIDIDGNTLEKYRSSKNGYGVAVNESISMDGEPHFALGDDDRCPHLDECGLCKIIINMGEEYLCDICREHPRFYNYTSVAEVGIGMSCIEAARIILGSPHYAKTVEIGELDLEPDDVSFDGRAARGEIYAILSDTAYDYSAALDKIYLEYSVDTDDDGVWLARLDSLEYLDPDHKKLFMRYSSKYRPDGADEYLERFFAYLVYRHCTEAFDKDDFCARLSFCLFCERLLASLIYSERAGTLGETATLASIISEEIEYSEDNLLFLSEKKKYKFHHLFSDLVKFCPFVRNRRILSTPAVQ